MHYAFVSKFVTLRNASTNRSETEIGSETKLRCWPARLTAAANTRT